MIINFSTKHVFFELTLFWFHVNFRICLCMCLQIGLSAVCWLCMCVCMCVLVLHRYLNCLGLIFIISLTYKHTHTHNFTQTHIYKQPHKHTHTNGSRYFSTNRFPIIEFPLLNSQTSFCQSDGFPQFKFPLKFIPPNYDIHNALILITLWRQIIYPKVYISTCPWYPS